MWLLDKDNNIFQFPVYINYIDYPNEDSIDLNSLI